MISSTVDLIPQEVAKTITVVRLATHKLIVYVDAVVGVDFFAITLADKHIVLVLPNLVLARHLQRLESLVTDNNYRGEPFLSLVLCPPTLIP